METRRELSELHQRLSTTMVYVTHDQTEAMTLGQRIVVMKNGEIEQIGNPMEVYDRPETRFVASFIGSPPMNFVAGNLTQNDGKLLFVASGLKIEIDQKQQQNLMAGDKQRNAELGVRAEDVIVEKGVIDGGMNSGRVSLCESLGDSKLLYISVNSELSSKQGDATKLVCRVEPRAANR